MAPTSRVTGAPRWGSVVKRTNSVTHYTDFIGPDARLQRSLVRSSKGVDLDAPCSCGFCSSSPRDTNGCHSCIRERLHQRRLGRRRRRALRAPSWSRWRGRRMCSRSHVLQAQGASRGSPSIGVSFRRASRPAGRADCDKSIATARVISLQDDERVT